MIADRKDVERYIEEFHRKAEKARDAYQETGNGSYERTWRKYQDLKECLAIALEKQSDIDNQRERRARNIRDYAERLEDRNYTKKEVESLLINTEYW